MSIPNPNPNIADELTVDNLTWSSNKIAAELKKIQDQIDEIISILPEDESDDT